MNIGRLDRRIVIEQPTNVASATTGEVSMTWETLDTVWATVTYPKSATVSLEGLEQARQTAVTPVEFTIRYREDVTEKMRIYYRSEYYNIHRVNYSGARNELLKLVTEKKY